MTVKAVEMRNIRKKFGSYFVLDDVSLNVAPGEIHVILGENGAGKSTLMNILAGLYQPDSGQIFYFGKEVNFKEPEDAVRTGVYYVQQECALFPMLTVAENIFVNNKLRRPFLKAGIYLDRKQMYREAGKLLAMLPVKINPRTHIKDLGLAQKRMVEILRAYNFKSQVLIMDEPTAALSEPEVNIIFTLIRQLKESGGVAIVYVTHKLEEMKTIGDRVTVLRDAKAILTEPVERLSSNLLMTAIAGEEYKERYPKIKVKKGPEVLKVDNLSSAKGLAHVSFSLHQGEVVGLAGLAGAGRSVLGRTLFGLEKYQEGTIYIEGKPVIITSPRDLLKAGVCFIPEDRETEGIFPLLDSPKNITISALTAVLKKGRLDLFRESRIAEDYRAKLGLKLKRLSIRAGQLSGGTKQKLIFARWLFAESKIFILDEPTRGVDIGTKVDIYNLINELIRSGAAVLLISSDLPELIGMSDRILIMRGGRLVKEADARSMTQNMLANDIYSP